MFMPRIHLTIPQSKTLDHVTSAVTGHQRSEVHLDRSAYLKHRAIKLEEQKQGQQECGILADVRLYVNGYLNDTTDIEMKRLVTLAGGEVLSVDILLLPFLTWLTGCPGISIVSDNQRRGQHILSHLSS